MILAWMAAACASGALITGAAMVAERAVAARGWPRRAVWAVAISCSILAAIAAPRVAIMRAAPLESAAVSQTTAAVPDATFAPLDRVLLLLWAAASVSFAIVLGLAHWRTTRRVRDFSRSWLAGHEIWISRDFGPATIGVRHPRIVVPAWVPTLPEADQALVVAHELQHIRARDAQLGLFGVLGALVMPWNLPVWMQLARLRLAMEIDCDARVVDGLPSTERGMLEYGQLLLRVSERAQVTRRPALALAQTRSSLGRRLDALLERDAAPRRRVAVLAALAAGLASSIALVPGPRGGDLVSSWRNRRIVMSAPTPPATRAPAIAPLAGALAPMKASAVRPRRTAKASAPQIPAPSIISATPSIDMDAIRAGVRASPLPRERRAAGFMTAQPSGAFGRARNQPVIRAIGGEVRPLTRPDTVRPPQ